MGRVANHDGWPSAGARVGHRLPRIGYDQGRPWGRVASRVHLVSAQIALDDDFATPTKRSCSLSIWLSKFSDEALQDVERVNGQRRLLKQAAKEPVKNLTGLDKARAALATSIFGVLFESTRCLGNVIATGASPGSALAVGQPPWARWQRRKHRRGRHGAW